MAKAFKMSDLLFYIDPPVAEARRQDLRADETSILDGINRQVAAAASLAEILDDLFTQTGAIAPCDRISLAFAEEDGKRIRSHYTRAAYQPILLGTGYAEDRATSTLVDVIERGRIRIIRDLAAYLDLKPRSPSTRLLVREGVRSSMTCPLTVDGRHVGVLFRSSRAVDAYDWRQAMLHLAIAERLSQAVESKSAKPAMNRAELRPPSAAIAVAPLPVGALT